MTSNHKKHILDGDQQQGEVSSSPPSFGIMLFFKKSFLISVRKRFYFGGCCTSNQLSQGPKVCPDAILYQTMVTIDGLSWIKLLTTFKKCSPHYSGWGFCFLNSGQHTGGCRSRKNCRLRTNFWWWNKDQNHPWSSNSTWAKQHGRSGEGV